MARTGADVWLKLLGVGSLNLVDMEAVFILKQSWQTVLMSCQSAKEQFSLFSFIDFYIVLYVIRYKFINSFPFSL